MFLAQFMIVLRHSLYSALRIKNRIDVSPMTIIV